MISDWKLLPPPVYALLLGRFFLTMPPQAKKKASQGSKVKAKKMRWRGESRSNRCRSNGGRLPHATWRERHGLSQVWWVENPWMVVGFRMMCLSWTTGDAPERLHNFREVGAVWWWKNVVNERSDQKQRSCTEILGVRCKKAFADGFLRSSKEFQAMRESFFWGGGETRKMNRLLKEAS